MNLRQINGRSDRDDAGGINFGVRHIVVTFNVIEIDRGRDPGLLIEVHQITLQIRIIDNPPNVAFEVTVIDNIEPNERAEETPVSFDNALAEQITAAG